MRQLHIINIDATHESLSLRLVAEQYGYQVAMTLVGNSSQIVDLLGRGQTFDVLLINGHGRDGQFLLPELGEEVAAQYPYTSALGVDELGEFLDLQANCVIGNCCSVGHRKMADTFISAGAKTYIAPLDYPDGEDTFKLVSDWLYWYGSRMLSSAEALSKSLTRDNDSQMYRLWSAE